MPAYEYECPELGLTTTLLRPVEERDKPLQLIRRTVPDSIAIAGAAANPHDPDAQMRAGFRRLEERGQLPRDFSVKQIKGALAASPTIL